MSVNSIKSNIESFKRKYYFNNLIRGLLFSFISFTAILLIFSSLEGFLWLGQSARMIFLIILIVILLTALVWGVIIPLSGLFRIRKGISDERAAIEVGKHFPEVSDKLLNYLQLRRLNNSEAALVNAALIQKTSELKIIPFKNAVNLKPNLKYAYLSLALLVFFTLVSFISPGFLSDSSSRIIQFNKEFERPAPFQFIIDGELSAFKNEPFELKVKLEGDYLPENVFLLDNGRRIQINEAGENSYTFRYPTISESKGFLLEAAGYRSKKYQITVYERPEIRDFQIMIDYPNYTRLENKSLHNTGSLVVPEGSHLSWSLNTSNSEEVIFTSGNKKETFERTSDQTFTYKRFLRKSLDYEIKLKNEHASNKSKIMYEISVIKDQRPELDVDFLPDTITYKSILLSGSISDDYGFKSLALHYKKGVNGFKKIPLSFDPAQNNQQFFLQWDLDSLQLKESEPLELYVSVKDNDHINGFKEVTSQRFFLRVPNKKEAEKIVEKSSNDAESQFDKTEERSETLNEKLQELEDRLKNKKELGWQEEKLLEDILKEKKDLQKSIEEMKKKHAELLRSQKEFGKQSDNLQKKSEELQKLIDETLDDETKELYEDIQKLLKEKAGSDQALDKISDIKSKEKNLEKELERLLEIFKRLKFETKLEQISNKLEELAEEQQELAEETQRQEESKSITDEDRQKITEQQEEINEKFEEIKKDINEAEKLNQDLKRPEPFEDFNQDEQEIQEKLEEIPENISKNDLKKASQQQQNAKQKMQKMSQKISQMQESMEMIMMQENIDQLRDILDNLIKLSFEEEKLVNAFQSVQQIDPRFIELSQEQLQLIDNSQVIKDSLTSLASRVVQISNFVIREISEISANMDEAMNELRERNKGKATSHQQYAMTSMNNLALMLDDVLSQMQMAMAEAMGKAQKNGDKESSLPNLSELQKQLGEQIKDLKKSGKKGRELSEELARLAAEQAKLREQLEALQEQIEGQPKSEEKGGNTGGNLKEAIEKMEENEVDMVNKRLTEKLIQRQQEIITRMLEAEESLREQKESPEREGETAKENIRKVPPEFEEYLKTKKSEIELLKTIPLDLNPFYKKEVNDYFRRLSEEDQ